LKLLKVLKTVNRSRMKSVFW